MRDVTLAPHFVSNSMVSDINLKARVASREWTGTSFTRNLMFVKWHLAIIQKTVFASWSGCVASTAFPKSWPPERKEKWFYVMIQNIKI